jgi:selenium metabolism protein YedF
MKKSIDAKGLACPEPVILCRKAMAEADLDEIELIVDNEAARQNVIRFLKFTGAAEPVVASRGPVHAISALVTAAMREKARGGASRPAGEEEPQVAAARLAAAQGATAPLAMAQSAPAQFAAKTVLLSSDQIGRGDETLGKLLARGLLNTLGELDRPPRTLVLISSGVRLAAEREETIELLKKIESRGVEILVCGTCLDYFHLLDSLRAGRVSNMYEIIEKLLGQEGVVTIS